MGILEILFFLLATFSNVHAGSQNVCPISYCGSYVISYPFKLQNIQPQDNCTYIRLTCNATLGTNGTIIASLPYAGNFYVHNIAYYDEHIQLYDPGNCLMGRLMKNLNLSSSPFKAIAYENYTFYTCPSDADIFYYYVPIGCLSNTTNSTIATSLISSDYMLEFGCQVIGSWLLPVLGPGQFEFDGISSDLYLTWKSTTCIACEGQNGGSNKYSFAKFAASPFFFPSFMIMGILLGICLRTIIRPVAQRNDPISDAPTADGPPVSTTAATAPPLSAAGGLDEFKINACTELVVLSESRVSPGHDSNACSICLESYLPKELLRSIAKCEHCFHAECIELWLRKNRTCPVCRRIISDIDL